MFLKVWLLKDKSKFRAGGATRSKKAKGKRQKEERHAILLHFCLLPFYFCLLVAPLREIPVSFQS
jgi:hypothetical protein